ncbi:N4-gp56 family major capsid protein [Paenibacillus sp. RUD330]|uniref:N4-gp56 family major capsid protein n=1 Tax=Paenibacillus sp. RUD330 TaxID=2023772 RepID=UPI000B92A77F|nr:N4-gp56 family major capsid protein [Paenibacillus sp. RUD330]ASS66217.1 N4-gp56 family major capsid protein [Paenibacillus sp. RUD330]
MATNVQGYNSTTGVNALTAEQATFYQDAMLDRLLPNLFYMQYGDKKNIPRNKGATTNFRRLNSLAVSTTALTEGVTPDGVDLSITAINATVSEYGNWTKISEFIDMTGLDPLLTEVSGLMGENAGESIDTIVRDIIAAGTNVLYPGTKTARNQVAGTDKISALDILRARRTLVRNKVKQIQLPNGAGMGYLAFIHPDVAMDLMQTQEWKDQNTYVNVDNRKNGMLGKMYGIYFLEVHNGVKFAGAGATGADVYGTIFIGKGAYGVPDIEGSSKPDIIVHKAGSAGTADPLNQFNTVAWKCAFTVVRLQELAILRYESGASV